MGVHDLGRSDYTPTVTYTDIMYARRIWCWSPRHLLARAGTHRFGPQVGAMWLLIQVFIGKVVSSHVLSLVEHREGETTSQSSTRVRIEEGDEVGSMLRAFTAQCACPLRMRTSNTVSDIEFLPRQTCQR